MQVEPKLMTISTAMARYSICRTTIYKYIRAGKLRAQKIGSATRLNIAEADEFFMGGQGG